MSETSSDLTLYGYWRSSSAYRVRIALNLKGLPHTHKAVHLVKEGGQQNTEEYRHLNPMGMVPALVHDDEVIVESLAICEYLEELYPQPALLPDSAQARAYVRSLVLGIACGVQPLNNLAVMQYLEKTYGADEAAIKEWMAQWIDRGFTAVETWLQTSGFAGDFCYGNTPGLADCFLVPQVYNAERFECDLGPYSRIREITARCRQLEAFETAAPENQPDAV